MIIIYPFVFLSDIVFFIKFKVSIIQIIYILSATIMFPILSSLIGVLVNLRYPKMNASNDTGVIKQSMSSFISVMIGMVISIISRYFIKAKTVSFRSRSRKDTVFVFDPSPLRRMGLSLLQDLSSLSFSFSCFPLFFCIFFCITFGLTAPQPSL